MSYQGGHNNGYWQDQPQGYGTPNPHPQLMTNGSPQPAQYYAPRQPSLSQPQVAQQWHDNGSFRQPQYGVPNGYAYNQAYPTMPMAQPQQLQPRYALSPPMQQQYIPQPQPYKRSYQDSSYIEQPQKRIHQSPHIEHTTQRSPQPSYGQRPQQSRPQQSAPQRPRIEQSPQLAPPNPTYHEQVHIPVSRNQYAGQPQQRAPQISHTPRSAISPSNRVSQLPQHSSFQPASLSSRPVEQLTISPSDVFSRPTEQRAISHSSISPRSTDQRTINPSNISSRPVEQNTISPPNISSRPPEQRTISPSDLMSRPKEQPTISPSNLLSRPPEQRTISPANLLSQHREKPTISPSNLSSQTTEQRTISPSNLMSRPEQPTIIPHNLLTQSAPPVAQHKSQIDHSMLLVALAEEYFDAAHAIAPSVSLVMDENSVEIYNKLIATGLGCLEAAMKKMKLPPRMEANVTLRFAGVLYDEDTDNFMDAELILSKGIATCERNHYYDIKYAMQFLLAQIMFRKNPKAAMKTLDTYIADSQAYRHYSWVYALRFLRVSYAMKSGSVAENHACLQNLRSITNVASEQKDHAIFQLASLMEAIAHLKSSGPESIENVQRAIAAASTYQLDEDSKLPQLVGLTHVLDVVCSIRRGNPTEMRKKLQAMQVMMDNTLSDPRWSRTSDTVALPINRPPKESHTVSHDTRAVLGIGDDGRDNLVVSFLSMKDAYAITYLLSGLIMLHDSSERKASASPILANERKGFQFLREGVSKLYADTRNVKNSSGLLPNLVENLKWRGQLLCYFHVYMAFGMAAIADWQGVRRSIDDARLTAKKMEVSLTGILGYLIPYLEGVLYQGLGNLDAALKIFQNERFNLVPAENANPSSMDQLEHDIAILATLNTLLMLRESSRQNVTVNSALIQRLEPLCTTHPNLDIRTAFHVSAATLKTDPPTQGIQSKNHLQTAMNLAKRSANKQFICITLNIMCSSFFHKIVGEQAEKSAKAALMRAKESGDPLWISVAEGLSAHCYEVQGNKHQAQVSFEAGREMAERALPGL